MYIECVYVFTEYWTYNQDLKTQIICFYENPRSIHCVVYTLCRRPKVTENETTEWNITQKEKIRRKEITWQHK